MIYLLFAFVAPLCGLSGSKTGVPPFPFNDVLCTVFSFPSGRSKTLPTAVLLPLTELITVIFDKSIVFPLFEINLAVVLLFIVTFSRTNGEHIYYNTGNV